MGTELKAAFFGLEYYDVRPLDGETWLVQNPGGLWGCQYGKDRLIPPDGFIFDYASIPRFAWRLIGPPTGHGEGEAYGLAAIFHDLAYEKGMLGERKCTRRQADDMMLDLMCQKVSVVVCGAKYWAVNVDRWRRNAMWLALRVGGGPHWRKHGHGR